MVKIYKPGTVELEAARAKNSFILVVNGGFDNKIYNDWESYCFKKGIAMSNTGGYGHSAKKEMFAAMAYWIIYKSPFIDLILAYAKKHPEANMQIFI